MCSRKIRQSDLEHMLFHAKSHCPPQCAQPWNLLNLEVLSRTVKLIFSEIRNSKDYNKEN